MGGIWVGGRSRGVEVDEGGQVWGEGGGGEGGRGMRYHMMPEIGFAYARF